MVPMSFLATLAALERRRDPADTGHGFCIADVYHRAVETQHCGF